MGTQNYPPATKSKPASYQLAGETPMLCQARRRVLLCSCRVAPTSWSGVTKRFSRCSGFLVENSAFISPAAESHSPGKGASDQRPS